MAIACNASNEGINRSDNVGIIPGSGDPRPVSFALWCYPTANSTTNNGLFVNRRPAAGAPTAYFAFDDAGSGGNGRLAIFSGAYTYMEASVAFSLNTWHHFAWTWAADNSCEAFHNGSSIATGTRTYGGTDHATTPYGIIGNSFGGANFQTNGILAELGAWDIVLSDDDIAMLASGLPPSMIRPDSLQAYVPCFGANGSSEVDLVNDVTYTWSGSVATSDHPPQVGGWTRRKNLLLVPGGGSDNFFASVMASVSTISPTAAVTRPVASVIASVSAVASALAVTRPVASVIPSVSAVSPTAAITRTVTSAIASLSTITSPEFARTVGYASTIPAVSAVAAAIDRAVAMTSTVPATSAVSGSIDVARAIAAVITAVSTITANEFFNEGDLLSAKLLTDLLHEMLTDADLLNATLVEAEPLAQELLNADLIAQ